MSVKEKGQDGIDVHYLFFQLKVLRVERLPSLSPLGGFNVGRLIVAHFYRIPLIPLEVLLSSSTVTV